MTLIDQIGPDTLARLEKAAERRFAEAAWLVEGKHRLAAVYFFGYVVEIVLGVAYFRMKDYGATQPILVKDLRRAVDAAKNLSRMTDKSHPVDGWAALLIQSRRELYPPPVGRAVERNIMEHILVIRETRGPKLRYRATDVAENHRATDVAENQLDPMRRSAEWFLNNAPKF